MDKHFANAAAKAGVNPQVIIAIVTAIGQVISQIMAGCKPAPTPAQVMGEAAGWRGTYVMYRALRQEGHRPLSAEGQRIIAALKDEAKTMTDDESAEFMQMCA